LSMPLPVLQRVSCSVTLCCNALHCVAMCCMLLHESSMSCAQNRPQCARECRSCACRCACGCALAPYARSSGLW
jgi:hypothetical protein